MGAGFPTIFLMHQFNAWPGMGNRISGGGGEGFIIMLWRRSEIFKFSAGAGLVSLGCSTVLNLFKNISCPSLFASKKDFANYCELAKIFSILSVLFQDSAEYRSQRNGYKFCYHMNE